MSFAEQPSQFLFLACTGQELVNNAGIATVLPNCQMHFSFCIVQQLIWALLKIHML